MDYIAINLTPIHISLEKEMFKVLFVNNQGGGFADYKEVESGATVSSLFEQEVGGSSENFLIRVNREQVSSSYLLKEGDRVTVTPTKIEGA